MNHPLTDRQQEIFTYIRAYWSSEGLSPTVREIAAAMKVTPMTIQRHLDTMEDRGFIQRVPRCPRSIRIVA